MNNSIPEIIVTCDEPKDNSPPILKMIAENKDVSKYLDKYNHRYLNPKYTPFSSSDEEDIEEYLASKKPPPSKPEKKANDEFEEFKKFVEENPCENDDEFKLSSGDDSDDSDYSDDSDDSDDFPF